VREARFQKTMRSAVIFFVASAAKFTQRNITPVAGTILEEKIEAQICKLDSASSILPTLSFENE